jgi:predicted Zn-dependent protease
MRRVTLLVALVPLTAPAQGVGKQQEIGKQLAQDVERREKVVADPAIVQYVNRIGQKVALAAASTFPLTVKVIAGDDPYAMAFPGGYCYLNTKLILTAAGEAELVGAIAHQMGHIASGHGFDPEGQYLLLVTPLLAWRGLCVRGRAMAYPVPVGFLKRQGEDESQADLLGLDYLDKAGYDPGALADLFERILAGGGKPSPSEPWLAFPASTRTRADALRNQRSVSVVNTSEFRDIQQRLAALFPPQPAPVVKPTLYPGR